MAARILDQLERLPDSLWALVIIVPTLAGAGIIGAAMYVALHAIGGIIHG